MATKWIEVIGDVVTKQAPREHVGILVITLLVAVVVSSISTWFIYSGNGFIESTIIIILAIVAFVVAMFLIRPPSKDTPSEPLPVPGETGERSGQWSRVMVNLPLQLNTLQELERRVGLIWRQAQEKFIELLRNRTPPVTADREYVRANIFLPDNREAVTLGEVCGLFIPKGLCQGMTNEAERRIRFRTNEGLTGRVYTEQRSLGARRALVNADWEAIAFGGMGRIEDRKFQLTQEQITLIDPELRWIISFPLQISKDGDLHTLGTFNVDGLVEVLSEQEMKEMYLALLDEVNRLISNLGSLPQCLVTISVDNLNV